MAIPIKRLKRIYHQFKTNNFIEFKEQEFNLAQYNPNIQIIDKDHENLLLYTTHVNIKYIKKIYIGLFTLFTRKNL